MMQSTLKPWHHRLLLVLLFALVSSIVLVPLGSNTIIPFLGDLINHSIAITQAKFALNEGQFPLRVVPMGMSGWRYAFFQFYAPTSYTIAAVIYKWLTPASPFMAYKVTVWLAMFLGGIYIYRLAFWFTQSAPAAMLAGVVYLTSPYTIILVNHMGAFNEAIAIGILPLIIYYSLCCYYRPGSKTFLQTSLAWYALATIHLITFLYTAFFLGIFLLFITVRNTTLWKHLLTVGVALGFSVLLALWHLVPIVVLAKYFWVQNTLADSISHLVHVPFYNLISPGAHILDSSNDLMTSVHPSVGLPVMLAGGICLYAMVYGRVGEKPVSSHWFYGLFIVFVLSFFMAWSPINFWQWLPSQVMVLQYSWRLLGQMMWVGALLFAWSTCWLFRDKLDMRHVIIGIILVITATKIWLPVNETYYVNISNYLTKRDFYYNPDSYALNVQRYLNHIDYVDVLTLTPQDVKDDSKPGVARIDLAKLLPQALFHSPVASNLLIEGHMADEQHDHLTMSVFLNGEVAAKFPLTTGKFVWQLPLDSKYFANKNLSPVLLQFKLDEGREASQGQHQHQLEIEKIKLTGFLQKENTLGLDQVSPNCHPQNDATVCHLSVPSTIRLVELPILYYPEMLRITLNGKPVSYSSVLYNERVITAIKPLPGKENIIKIQFRGLAFANDISRVAWGVAGLLLLLALKPQILRTKKAKK